MMVILTHYSQRMIMEMGGLKMKDAKRGHVGIEN